MDNAKRFALDFIKPFKTMCFKIPRAQTVEDHLVVAVGIDVRSGMIIKTKH